MATKKQTALAKQDPQGGGLVVAAWMKEMAEKARNVSSIFRTGVPRIIHRQAALMIDGQLVKGNKLSVVVIEAAFEKAYYAKSFNADEKSTPDCYSFHAADKPAGEAHNEMVPQAGCADPQAERCAGCKWNRFGTAVRQDGSPGKGKRCGDKIRLLCITPGSDRASMLKQEVRVFSVPANSLGNWGAYVGLLADQGIMPQMVVTEIGTEVLPPPNQGYKITFRPVESLPEAAYRVVEEKQALALQTLMMPYPTLGAEAEPEETEEQKAKNKKRAGKVK